jgi:hypothetical protein
MGSRILACGFLDRHSVIDMQPLRAQFSGRPTVAYHARRNWKAAIPAGLSSSETT